VFLNKSTSLFKAKVKFGEITTTIHFQNANQARNRKKNLLVELLFARGWGTHGWRKWWRHQSFSRWLLATSWSTTHYTVSSDCALPLRLDLCDGTRWRRASTLCCTSISQCLRWALLGFRHWPGRDRSHWGRGLRRCPSATVEFKTFSLGFSL